MDDNATGSLPLGAAIKEWSDPDLFEAMLKCDAHLEDLRWKTGIEVELARTMAWVARKAFLDDVRWRIEIGVILLSGVEAQPEPKTTRSVIPGEWATAMEFDIPNRAVACFGYRWIAVKGTLGDASTPDAEPTTPGTEVYGNRGVPPVMEIRGAVDADDAAVNPDLHPDPNVPSLDEAGPKRGREAFSELIMEALRAHYTDTTELPATSLHGWSALAPRILKILEHQHPMRHAAGRLPSLGTMRTRLPQLYSRLLDERRVQK